MSFKSLGLPSSFLSILEKLNYKQAYPIQEKVIPVILSKKDVLGIAKTGSGKTAGFVIPVLMNLKSIKSRKNRHIDSLVLVPTRELAVQVEAVFQQFKDGLRFPVKTLAVHGGVSINPQMQALQNVNVLVATPGRLLDLLSSNALHLDSVQSLVIDEADKMLNLGFKKEMNEIFGLLPKRRQNLLFSATLSPEIQSIKELLLDAPEIVEIETEKNDIDLIEQVAYKVAQEKKGPLLRHLIKERKMDQVLIFTSSIFQADSLTKKLKKNGIDAMAIHGKKSQGSRTESLSQFKRGKIQALVATDLLSRGIDIEFLPFVINYELPRSPKDYVHRIGRTGRAENPGLAISLITEADEHHFRVIQKKMKKRVDLLDSDEMKFS